MGLFSPIWMTKNEKKENDAVQFVRKLQDSSEKDRALLKKIVENAPLLSVRRAAISRISDSGILSKLYPEEEAARDRIVELSLDRTRQLSSRGFYMKMINDEETFCKLLIQDPNDNACYYFKDWESRVHYTQKGLMKIARDAKGKFTRSWAAAKAFYKTDDAGRFKGVKDKTLTEDVRMKALELIKDPEILAAVANDNNMPESFRSYALRHIKDQETLIKYAGKREIPVQMRVAALKNIDDQEMMERLAFSDDDIKVREAAVYKLKKDNTKLQIIRDTIPELKNAACDKMGHVWDKGHYKSHGNGGRDIVYTCTICGKINVEPYEWSTADSV